MMDQENNGMNFQEDTLAEHLRQSDEMLDGMVNPGQQAQFNSSLAEILANNLGYYVICEFLIGTNNIVYKDGILYAAGNNFLTLYQEEEDRYVVCDFFSLRFVNFYDSTTKPRNLRNIRRQP